MEANNEANKAFELLRLSGDLRRYWSMIREKTMAITVLRGIGPGR